MILPPEQLSVVDGRADRLTDPLGIDCATPRLSWRMETAEGATYQTAYQVQVSDSPDFASLEADTGWVSDPSPLDRPWPGQPLSSRQRRWWRARVATTRGESGWSRPWSLEAGLMRGDDWVASYIGPNGQTRMGGEPQPCPLLRRSFRLDDGIEQARLYVTALGLYEVGINGSSVTSDHLTPGWTDYRHRLLYRTYDVTHLLGPGENVIGATLADGWYRGYLGWSGERGFYGRELALLAQLEIRTPGGRTVTVATDRSWRSSSGAIRSADLYMGEDVDLSYDQPGWSAPRFDESAWAPVELVDGDLSVLAAASSPPVRPIAELPPAGIERRPDGSLLVDFGQNLVGHLRITLPGGPPRRVTVRHAEILHPDGSLRTDLLRLARATDTLTTVAEGDPVVFEPRFTFHGFRYAEIHGVPELDPGADTAGADVVAVVVSSDLDDIGSFHCDNAELNKLHENTRWSLRGNFVSVPTDCPQRDERLGWTGDAQVFAPAASFMVDAGPFLTSWLHDVVSEQRDDGAIPWVVPNVLGRRSAGAAGWGDVITCMPWDLYLAYGDSSPLELTYEAMTRWVGFEMERAGDDLIWSGDFQFGDWLDPDAPPGRPADAKARADLVASAYMAHSLDLAARTARLLGHLDEAEHYGELTRRARKSWWATFGPEAVTTQTGAAMALEFELAPPGEVKAVGDRLHELIDKADGHLATGFLGTPLLCRALTRAGYVDDAYRVLLQHTPPSWLYPITQGATTIWERWDALRPDGSIPTDPLSATNHSMVSFNHYAYGAVADFLHRTVAGLAPDTAEPGYRRVVVEPRPGGGLRAASALHHSRYGPVGVDWRVAEGHFDLTVSLPPGTRASVRLPDGGTHPDVPSGTHRFGCRWAPAGPGPGLSQRGT